MVLVCECSGNRECGSWRLTKAIYRRPLWAVVEVDVEVTYVRHLGQINRMTNRFSAAFDVLLTYRMRSPLARASSVTRYMANRAGRSVVTSGATIVGAAEATIASAAVQKEDKRSLILMRVGVVCVLNDEDCGLTRAVMVPLIYSPTNSHTDAARQRTCSSGAALRNDPAVDEQPRFVLGISNTQEHYSIRYKIPQVSWEAHALQEVNPD